MFAVFLLFFTKLLMMLPSVFYFFLTLVLLIVVHESGHFLVARCCGVKVLRFSFGFGKIVGTWRDKYGTDFTLSLLPLGGYVKFLDENEGPVADIERQHAFNTQPRWARVAIILAGPLFNFIFAFLLLWLVAIIGIKSFAPRIDYVKPGSVAALAHLGAMQEIIELNGHSIKNWRDVHYAMMPLMGSSHDVTITVKKLDDAKVQVLKLPLRQWHFDAKHSDLLESLGIVPLFPKLPVIVGLVSPNSPAQFAGFTVGDEIIAVDQQPISDWHTLISCVRARAGASMVVKILRQGKLLLLDVHLRSNDQAKTGLLGISSRPNEIPPDWLRIERSTPIAAISQAFHQTAAFTVTTITLMGRTVSGKLPLDNLSGPIGIAKAAGEAVQIGAVYYLFFIALLSISIGVLNLLPIPLLDGGHLLYELIEVLIRRPLSKEWKMRGIFLGMMLVILLTVVALYNDLA